MVFFFEIRTDDDVGNTRGSTPVALKIVGESEQQNLTVGGEGRGGGEPRRRTGYAAIVTPDIPPFGLFTVSGFSDSFNHPRSILKFAQDQR